MKLANTTNFPDDKIREIIQFVKPNNLPTSVFDVRIRNGSGSGHFQPSGDEIVKHNLISNRSKAGCIVAPNRPQIFATITNDKRDYPDMRNQHNRVVKLYWEQWNEKKGKYQTWHWYKDLPITKAYMKKHKDWATKIRNSGYIPHLILSREEDLVDTLAHEFRHFWQVNHPGKRGKVWGARGKFSERDTDAYAIRKVRQWRKLYAVDIYPEQPDTIPITS